MATKCRLELFYKSGIIAKMAVVVPIVTKYAICTIKQDRKSQSNREKGSADYTEQEGRLLKTGVPMT